MGFLYNNYTEAMSPVKNAPNHINIPIGSLTSANRDLVIVLTCVYYAVAQLVGHCATSRDYAGSIPDGVIGIFFY